MKISLQSLTSSNYIKDLTEEIGPLQVSNPQKIELKYLPLKSFIISFILCDYADNCHATRYYNINNDKYNNNNTSQVEKKLSHFLLKQPSNETKDISGSELSTTYVNPKYNFQIKFPHNWIPLAQDIYDKELFFNSAIADSIILNLLPIEEIKNNSISNYLPEISMLYNEYKLGTNTETLYDYFSNSDTQLYYPDKYKIINKNITLYDGLIAKEIIIEYISSSGKNLESLGLSDSGTKERKALFTDIIFNNNKYTFSFEAHNDIFDKYLPIVNKILKSFRPYTDNYNSTDSIFRKSYKVNEDYKLFYNDNKPPMTLHNYTNAKFGYSIMYPPDSILKNHIYHLMEK